MSLAFLGAQRATFTTFSLPPAAWSVPGRRVDLPITELLPFHGGTVEIEVALYEADVEGPLHTAIDVVSGLASLMGPPLATAATVAEKISDGLDTVVSGSGEQPVLAVPTTLVAPVPPPTRLG